MARALQEAAEHGLNRLTANGKFFADRALEAGGLAIVGIKMHDLRGGLDSSGQLPGPRYPAPDDPAPDWIQERIEGLAGDYGKVHADHRGQHAAFEALRRSGIDAPSTAPPAKGSSGDGARSGFRGGETRHTSRQLGSN
jgi:hypothetical protein